MRVTIFDYGAGNLHSLEKALTANGVDVVVETDPLLALQTDALVLPGVGAFTQAAERLLPARAAMRQAIDRGLPTIGICLGMQLLFERSDEGEGAGLGVLGGIVRRLRARRVPQIGWNSLEYVTNGADAPLDVAYFANSYVAEPADRGCVVAWSSHEGDRFPAIVRAQRAIGVQFHPEKSSAIGVRFLQAALAEVVP